MSSVQKYAGTFILTLNVVLAFALIGLAPSLWQSHDRDFNQASKAIKDSGAVSEQRLAVYCMSNAWFPPYGMDQTATPLDVMQELPRRSFRTMEHFSRLACGLLLLNSVLLLWQRQKKQTSKV